VPSGLLVVAETDRASFCEKVAGDAGAAFSFSVSCRSAIALLPRWTRLPPRFVFLLGDVGARPLFGRIPEYFTKFFLEVSCMTSGRSWEEGDDDDVMDGFVVVKFGNAEEWSGTMLSDVGDGEAGPDSISA